MVDKSYYQLRKYLVANLKCDLDCPTVKKTLEALDACNFIAAYKEIGKMVSGALKRKVLAGLVVQHDPVMEIKLRACKQVLSMVEADADIMEYAIRKNLDFACCSRSSYGDCLIALLANCSPKQFDGTILKQLLKLSKAYYRTDYDIGRIEKEFPEAFSFMKDYSMETIMEKVQRDAQILENEWIS